MLLLLLFRRICYSQIRCFIDGLSVLELIALQTLDLYCEFWAVRAVCPDILLGGIIGSEYYIRRNLPLKPTPPSCFHGYSLCCFQHQKTASKHPTVPMGSIALSSFGGYAPYYNALKWLFIIVNHLFSVAI